LLRAAVRRREGPGQRGRHDRRELPGRRHAARRLGDRRRGRRRRPRCARAGGVRRGPRTGRGEHPPLGAPPPLHGAAARPRHRRLLRRRATGVLRRAVPPPARLPRREPLRRLHDLARAPRRRGRRVGGQRRPAPRPPLHSGTPRSSRSVSVSSPFFSSWATMAGSPPSVVREPFTTTRSPGPTFSFAFPTYQSGPSDTGIVSVSVLRTRWTPVPRPRGLATCSTRSTSPLKVVT